MYKRKHKLSPLRWICFIDFVTAFQNRWGLSWLWRAWQTALLKFRFQCSIQQNTLYREESAISKQRNYTGTRITGCSCFQLHIFLPYFAISAASNLSECLYICPEQLIYEHVVGTEVCLELATWKLRWRSIAQAYHGYENIMGVFWKGLTWTHWDQRQATHYAVPPSNESLQKNTIQDVLSPGNFTWNLKQEYNLLHDCVSLHSVHAEAANPKIPSQFTVAVSLHFPFLGFSVKKRL